MTPPSQSLAAALGHLQAGRLDEAQDVCRQLLEREPDSADALHLSGVLAHRSGRNAAAIDLIRRAVALLPNNPEFHFNLGVAQQVAGLLADAAASYEQALRLQPYRADAHNNLGYTLLQQGRLQDAGACFERALELRPDFSEAIGNRGELLLRLGRFADAADCLRHALRLRPEFPEAANHLGVVLREQGRHDEAEACFHQALRVRPDFAGAHNNLGRICEDRGRTDEAVARYRLALCYQPRDASVHNNLANLLATRGKATEALPIYEQAVRLQPGEPVYQSNLAHTLTLLGRPEEAEARCRSALRLRADFADARHNLAITLAAQGRFDEALVENEEALRLQPEHAGARNCRALWWLQNGEFERGWPEYEWRWKIRGVTPRTFRQPLWDGAPLDGRTILIHAEQALGDTVQFIRYAPLVRRRGGTVIVECQPPLVPLLRGCVGIDQLVARGSPLPECDVQAPLLSLPGILRTTPATVPAEVPYLSADPALLERWQRELAGISGFKVGIAWQGNPAFPGDSLRSIALTQFALLARVPGVRLIGLQKGPGREQIAAAVQQTPLLDLGERLDETAGAFMDTAAAMKCLDLVVTSDTAMAHLAGALAVPVWVALAAGCDWRWLRDCDDCPWYPTMRLFRQRRLYDWGEVFERMAGELRARLGPPRTALHIPSAPGELIDKITILEIKAERIRDDAKLRNVRIELAALSEVRDRELPATPELANLTSQLRAVNETLWQIEDNIRLCERAQDFGPHFIELARSVYRTNDRRSEFKRRINELLGADLIEEKSYARYDATADAPLR